MKFRQKLGKKLNILVLLIVSVLILMAPSTNCQGKGADQPQNINLFLSTDQVFENVYWASGQNINLNSQMKDDVYLAGANVVVSGPIDGDLMVAGSSVVINSVIKGDLRVAGATVTINGKIEGNLTALGGTITINKDAEIGKSAIILGGNVDEFGKIKKNLYCAAGNLLINNEITGSAYIGIDAEGSLTLLPSAIINGNFEYTAPFQAEIQAGAQIKGEEKFTQLKIETPQPAAPNYMLRLIFWLAGLLGAIVVGLVMVFIFKNFVGKIKMELEKNIILNILKGFVYLIVIPIALMILAVTFIGFPLSMILGGLYLTAIYLCRIFIGVYIGEKVLKKIFRQNAPAAVWSMIIGLLIIYLICSIPLLGWFVKLAIVLWGLGTLLSVLKKELKLEN
ncbi:MAG: polymer-forming cytoskeletal protein [Candidatus Parcubacteria bacterium]|nr:polymer-forming cytoskeletal protein [Candidatus Parcubacteria bacterium]